MARNKFDIDETLEDILYNDIIKQIEKPFI